MSTKSQPEKVVLTTSKSVFSAGHLVPLPKAQRSDAKIITLWEWLKLPIDDRAPVRSVTIVKTQPDGFNALVIDTVVGQLRWSINLPRDQLATLYENILGTAEERSRSTMIISAESGPGDDLTQAESGSGDVPPQDPAWPSDPGPKGPGGMTPVLLGLARLHVLVQTSLLVEVDLPTAREGTVNSALLVRPLDAQAVP